MCKLTPLVVKGSSRGTDGENSPCALVIESGFVDAMVEVVADVKLTIFGNGFEV